MKLPENVTPVDRSNFTIVTIARPGWRRGSGGGGRRGGRCGGGGAGQGRQGGSGQEVIGPDI